MIWDNCVFKEFTILILQRNLKILNIVYVKARCNINERVISTGPRDGAGFESRGPGAENLAPTHPYFVVTIGKTKGHFHRLRLGMFQCYNKREV